jgi:hypothetical protein
MRRLLVLAALVLVVPEAANAFVFAGRPWPNHRVTYYNTVTSRDWAVKKAVAAWNTSGADVRFVPAAAGSADVRIQLGPVPTGNCGFATYGDQGGAHVNLVGGLICGSSGIAVEIIAHELGHILGLGHEFHKCALMNVTGGVLGLCHHLAPLGFSQYLCDPLQPDDIAGAVALYGGHPREVTRPVCDAWTPLGAPTGLTVTGTLVQWRDASASTPLLPGLGAFVHPSPNVVLAVAQGHCPSDPTKDGFIATVAAKPGQQNTYTTTTFAPGQYCVAAWTQDLLQRHSTLVTAQFTVVGP